MLWHREEFDQHADFRAIKRAVLSDFELADLLIAKSMTVKTTERKKTR